MIMKLSYDNVGGISFTIIIMHLINMEFILSNDVATMVEELLNKKCGDIMLHDGIHVLCQMLIHHLTCKLIFKN
jgi:hypothetical protein